jgi:hypothetical protein
MDFIFNPLWWQYITALRGRIEEEEDDEMDGIFLK